MGLRLPKSRRAVLCLAIAGVVAVAAAAVISAVFLWGSGSTESSPATQATRTPLPGAITVANTLDDALFKAAPAFTGPGSTLSLAKPESVSYVETTVGKARAMLAPDRPGGWSLPDDASAWVIVAYGRFKSAGAMGAPDVKPAVHSTVWVVVVKGIPGAGPRVFAGDEPRDLSQLGTVVSLPLERLQRR